MKIVPPPIEHLDYFRKYYKYDGKNLFGKRGKAIGTIVDNHVIIQGPKIAGLKKRQYYAHHIIWFLENNYWPINQLDHKDVNGINNDIMNLREADHHINSSNRKSANGLPPGVQLRKNTKKAKKYRVYIRHNYNKYYLGSFADPVEAHKAYCTKYKELTGREYIFE